MLRPRPTRVPPVVAAVVAAALVAPALAACSSGSTAGSSAGSSAGSTPPAAASTTPACSSSAATLTWPAAVPRDFPTPPGAALTGTKQLPSRAAGAKHGVVVSLSVPAALRDEIRYVTRALPAAGFTLGRGDAEQDEADLPFSRKDVTGQLRLRHVGACRTTWILTVLPR